MLGLSAIMQAGSVVFEIVRWAGVAYLIFMGVSMIREGGALQLKEERSSAIEPMLVVVRRGILLNLLNLKLTVFFAFLPQFLDSPAGLLDARLISPGGIFMAMTFAVFAL
jgi:threonine/homoserine/homoserine lactone efflux protein